MLTKVAVAQLRGLIITVTKLLLNCFCVPFIFCRALGSGYGIQRQALLVMTDYCL